MKKSFKKVLGSICGTILMVSMVACSSSNTEETGVDSKVEKESVGEIGETISEDEAKEKEMSEITVMIPPWGEPPAEMLNSFTEESGIKVIMNIVGWDEIKNKVSIAAVGNKAAADVIEVDWSWVGEFGSADWFEPIVLTDDEKSAMPTVSSFQYGDSVIALPYANDYRLAYYNMEHFSSVGIETMPETWDEVIEACVEIKKAGIVEYPLTLTLSATEAATTSLLWMTLSNYGEFFNEDFSVNKENVLPSLQNINKLVNEDKLIDPASQNMKDIEVYGKLTSGDASFMVGPTYFIGQINNPELSSVVGKTAATLVPGNGEIKTATFALPEGVGISKYSENKDAALEFVKWYTSPEVQIELYSVLGNIPTQTSALESLIDDGIIEGGEVMIEQSSYIASPFPGGIPPWYPEMSNTIYNSVNQMVSGSLTPEEAYDNIEKKVSELSK